MSAAAISLDKAKSDKLFYFVATVIVYRPADGRCLILKRSERETVHPGKWGIPGGKLEWRDLDPVKATRLNGDVVDFEHAVEDLLAREAMEEAGVTVGRDIRYVNSVAYIRPDGVPSLLVEFAAPYLGGEVRIDEHDFSDYAWVNADEIKAYDCIMGIPEEVGRAIAAYAV